MFSYLPQEFGIIFITLFTLFFKPEFCSTIMFMKRFLTVLVLLILFTAPSFAFSFIKQENAVKNVVISQFRYANKGNFDKFIATYDKRYKNSDGFDLKTYSDLVKETWATYNNIKYNAKVKNITVNDCEAKVEVTEYTTANLQISPTYTGELDSVAESIYYLRKVDGKWKVISDSVIDETTKMLYGAAKDLDIKLIVPTLIDADTEYTASLEFVTPKNMIAIASIAADKVEYPQPKAKEVFRPMPEDNILERLFTSNSDNANEYVIASIGLTQTDICDLSIKMSLTGFGYVIRRVNVISKQNSENQNVEN